MAVVKRIGVKLSPELSEMIRDELTDHSDLNANALVNEIVEQYFEQSSQPRIPAMDTETKQQFFSYLKPSEKEPYKQELHGLELTEQELLDLAIVKSGKSFDVFVKEALIAHAKEQITFAARREHIDQSTEGSPAKRLQEAFAELTELEMSGQGNFRGGKLNLTAIANRARVNYQTARKWALQNQPELLEKPKD